MSIKSFLIKQLARYISKQKNGQALKGLDYQEKIRQELVAVGQTTAYGKDHQFDKIVDYASFKQQVPLVDYEALRPYVERINAGEENVLWKGRPKYYAKTSGTTSGAKFIPLTKESIPNHFGTARNSVFNYIAQTGKADFMDGKMIFLSGSPALEKKGDILLGRLSGISNHLVPSWLKGNQLPSYETNCIEDWEEKLDRIVEETKDADMRLISGIPPWVQMYYERLLERTGKKTVLEVFPNLSIFVYGGVNFEPYREKLESLVGGRIPSVETYPASEGFIAYQDQQDAPGLLLNINSGIFFEFVPADQYFSENPPRLSLAEVELGVNYALVLNTNAGLWGYSIGDTVQFISKDPYRILVTGRIKHYISAFGEHVIGKEVEQALLEALEVEPAKVVEFSVAPQVTPPEGGKPYHEWWVAFDQLPENLELLAERLDLAMRKQNIYYEDLVRDKILQPLKIRPVPADAFRQYMKSIGKLGGQNKVPRLSDDRKIADKLRELFPTA
ncbi:GH3 auxin-responsive promoter family protein [Saprospira grandis]|uniref:GH3 auxin-responsive promoter family protein n=1 Tax=Saprospira grandis TaxID=1008 RepID=UPI0022DCF9FC|nr:GH3 auxin-responsive promoter family protein [Saprospira grandis]WBM75399.1 GH3 auxin-responsive promoter family protein [Saprospira grandis]